MTNIDERQKRLTTKVKKVAYEAKKSAKHLHDTKVLFILNYHYLHLSLELFFVSYY